MDGLRNFAQGLFEPRAPLPPSPGKQKKKDKQKRREEAERLAREKFLAKWGCPPPLSQEPSLQEASTSAVRADYFSTNLYEAGSSTGVYQTPSIQEESNEYYEPKPEPIPEVELTFTSPLLPDFSLNYGLLPETPSNNSTTTEEAQQPSEVQSIMAHALTDIQLQAIMTAAIQAVNGDEKNLKPQNRNSSLYELKTSQTSCKNAISGSQSSQLPILVQQRRSSMPYHWLLTLPKCGKMPSSMIAKEKTTFAQETIVHNSKHCWKEVLLIPDEAKTWCNNYKWSTKEKDH